MVDQGGSELEIPRSELFNKAQLLLNEAKKRLGRSHNPAASCVLAFLEQEFNRVFLTGKGFTRLEEQAHISLLRVFSRNNYPHEENDLHDEEKRSNRSKTNGSVKVSCENRVHREEGDFFLIHSKGKVIDRSLEVFFAQRGIEMVDRDYDLIAKFLGEGKGKRAMVWTNPEGFIFGVRQNEKGIQFLTSVSSGGSYLIECSDSFKKIDYIIHPKNGLITAFIPVPREELNLQYSNAPKISVEEVLGQISSSQKSQQ